MQQQLCKLGRKEDKDMEFIMDVSACFRLPVILPNGEKSPHLVLFCCIYKTKTYSFPAFHMALARQDAQTITDFLAEIKKTVESARTFVSDFGKVILIGTAHVSAVFTNVTIISK